MQALLMVTTRQAEQAEGAFAAWHANEHFEKALSIRGFTAGTAYRRIDMDSVLPARLRAPVEFAGAVGGPRTLMIYEIEVEDLPDLRHVAGDFVQRFRSGELGDPEALAGDVRAAYYVQIGKRAGTNDVPDTIMTVHTEPGLDEADYNAWYDNVIQHMAWGMAPIFAATRYKVLSSDSRRIPTVSPERLVHQRYLCVYELAMPAGQELTDWNADFWRTAAIPGHPIESTPLVDHDRRPVAGDVGPYWQRISERFGEDKPPSVSAFDRLELDTPGLYGYRYDEPAA